MSLNLRRKKMFVNNLDVSLNCYYVICGQNEPYIVFT